MTPAPVTLVTAAKKPGTRRAIVLFDLELGKMNEALRRLSRIPGVTETSALEGPPDLLVITAAPTRRQLVRGTLVAIAALEDVTLSVCCLLVRATPRRLRLTKPAA